MAFVNDWWFYRSWHLLRHFRILDFKYHHKTNPKEQVFICWLLQSQNQKNLSCIEHRLNFCTSRWYTKTLKKATLNNDINFDSCNHIWRQHLNLDSRAWLLRSRKYNQPCSAFVVFGSRRTVLHFLAFTNDCCFKSVPEESSSHFFSLHSHFFHLQHCFCL